MSERMTPIPFKQLMTWIKEEHDNFGTVFGVNAPYEKTVSYTHLRAHATGRKHG